jgi:hypothetical protein
VAGTIIADVIQSDQSYPSSINIASPVIISNTFAFPAGTVSAPAFFPTGDTNTGIFFPAADTIAFTEGGVEAMRIDSSGNVGIGTSSPQGTLHVTRNHGSQPVPFGSEPQVIVGGAQGGGGAQGYMGSLWFASADGTADFNKAAGIVGNSLGDFNPTSSEGHLEFYTTPANSITPAERMRIDSSGNVGIGTSSPTLPLDVVASSNSQAVKIRGRASDNLSALIFDNNSGNASGNVSYIQGLGSASGYLAFATTNTERMRINSRGNVGIGTTSPTGRLNVVRSDNVEVFRVTNNLASGTTNDLSQVISAQAAGTGFNLLRLFTSGGGAAQFSVRGDGTIFAQNTTVQSISDARTKENVRTSEEGLDVISALRPVRFDFKEGFGNNRKNQLGFVAQEMEPVFPDAVSEWEQNSETYKSVGPGALIPVLVKAIQEQQAIIESLKTRIETLEAK